MGRPYRIDVLLGTNMYDLADDRARSRRPSIPMVLGAIDHSTLEVIDQAEEDELWEKMRERMLGPAKDEYLYRTVAVILDEDDLIKVFDHIEIHGSIDSAEV